jgi:lysophospholipase L1-like esterase
MARIPESIFRNWKNKEVVYAEDYKREREIMRTAINDFDNDVKEVQALGRNNIKTENIMQNAIVPEKTSFLQRISENIIDERLIVSGGYYSPSGGDWKISAGYKASGIVGVKNGDMVRGNYVSLAIYDANLNVLTVPKHVNGVTTFLEGSAYVRFNFAIDNAYPTVYKVSHNQSNLLYPAYDEYSYKDDFFRLSDKNVTDEFEITERNAKFFGKERTVNLFDKEKVVIGRYDVAGNYGNLENTVMSASIPCVEGKTFKSVTSGYVTFLDGNGNFVSGLSPTNTFAIPSGKGIAFFRKAVLKENIETEMIVEGNELPSFYIPYYEYYLKPKYLNLNPKLSGKKWNTLGDSITEKGWGGIKKYDAIIAETNNLDLVNYGDGGTRITKSEGRVDSFVERYLSMRLDADIITVMGGLNDIGGGVPLGTMSDSTPTTFYGALHELCAGLLDRYVGKSIGFITPTLTVSALRPRDRHEQFTKAIKEVCAYYSIPVLDLTNAGMLNPHIPSVRSSLFYDDTHPNDLGHETLAKTIEHFIESIA